MRAWLLVVLLVACGPAPKQPVVAPAVQKPRVIRQIVFGGETLELDGVQVHVEKVTFLDQPCPPGEKCIHSGVIRRVKFVVLHRGTSQSVVVQVGESVEFTDASGSETIEHRGVRLRVLSVTSGPEAEVELEEFREFRPPSST